MSQPMLDALAEKYRDREKPSAMGALLFENPEYKGSLKTLQNKAQELFGMSLVKYFRSIGIMAEKGSLRSRAASSNGREKTAVGFSPAATARLKDLYQGLNPRFYGTFEDAVRKLEGLEAMHQGRSRQILHHRGHGLPPGCGGPPGLPLHSGGAFQNQEALDPGCFFRTYELEDGWNNHPQPLTNITVDVCTRLESIRLPRGLRSIGEKAFQGTSIETFALPPEIESIGQRAFAAAR